MAGKNTKRVSLYFNIEDDQERKRWEFIEEWSSKSAIIKKLIDDAINGATTNFSSSTAKKVEPVLEEIKNSNDLDLIDLENDENIFI